MGILNEKISGYIKDLTNVKDTVLLEMEKYGESIDFPFVEPEVGQMLMCLAKSINARRIFELGSGFGYSAAWFLKSFPPDQGEIICTDRSKENVEKGYEYFKRLGANNRITYMQGDAVESLNKTEGQFDIIYNDIDKAGYPQAFETAITRLRSGGLFIADNVLWSGRVVEPDPDEDTRGIMKFNELIYSSPQVFSFIVPLRDGISVTLKI